MPSTIPESPLTTPIDADTPEVDPSIDPTFEPTDDAEEDVDLDLDADDDNDVVPPGKDGVSIPGEVPSPSTDDEVADASTMVPGATPLI